jgi:hypothetical protein
LRRLSLTLVLLFVAAVSPAQAGHPPALERRVAVYTQTLDLNANQQAQLRVLLLWQRDEMQRVWNDTTLTAAMRVHATQAISGATANRIRAMLTEQQRKRYNPPPAPHDNPVRADSASVEYWMNMEGARK